MAANFDMAATYRHFVNVMQDSQNAAGSVPAKTPPYPPALYYNNDAGWTVGYPLVVDLLLQRYNDTDSVRAHWPNLLKLWANVTGTLPDGAGVASAGQYAGLWVDIDRDGKFVNGDLGDWAASDDEWPFDVTKDSQPHTPSALVSTFWLVQFAESMSRFCRVLGEVPERFERQAKASKLALHSHFWNATGQRYSTEGLEPPGSLSRFPRGHHAPPSQTLQSLPLYANITPAAQTPAALRALLDSVRKTDYHLLSGIVGTKFALPALAMHGSLDAAMKILTARPAEIPHRALSTP